MEWIKLSKYNLPPQGLKILCFRKGDMWVARRFTHKGQNIWVELCYDGVKGSCLTDAPDFWVQVQLPQGYTGYMKISVEDEEQLTFDEFQKKHPDHYEEFVSAIVSRSHDGRRWIE